MASWRIGKDALVQSGGGVFGPEDDGLTFDLRAIEFGYAQLQFAPPNLFAVDPNSDWMIDRFVRGVAASYGVDVITDYEPKDADIPAEVRAYLNRDKSSDGGVVY
jgi:hypothetical protein